MFVDGNYLLKENVYIYFLTGDSLSAYILPTILFLKGRCFFIQSVYFYKDNRMMLGSKASL